MENKMTNTPWIYGLIGGASIIVFTLILYIGGVSWFMSGLAFVHYLILITIAVLCGLKERKLYGGFISFGQALKVLFLYFVIAKLMMALFEYALFNFIDIPFRQAISQKAAEGYEKMLSKFGTPQDKIDETVNQLLSGESYNLRNTFLGYAMGLIGWFLCSLIIAAIIKRTRPPFDNIANQPNQ